MDKPANMDIQPSVFKNQQVQQLEQRIEQLEQKLILFELNHNSQQSEAKRFDRQTYEIIRQFDQRFNQLESFVSKQASMLNSQQKQRLEKQREAQGKVRQPIPSLGSWLVVATVFSYFGDLDQVVDLFQHMSPLSRKYIRSFHSKLIRQVIPKNPVDMGKLRKLPLISAPGHGAPEQKFEWPKQISDFGPLRADQLKQIKLKDFKIMRYSAQIKNMIGLQIELRNQHKSSKQQMIRFEAQAGDEANEEDIITSTVRGSPEPSKQCEHIQCIGHSACTIQCDNRDKSALFCQDPECPDGQLDQDNGLHRCSKFGNRYHCSCHKTNCKWQHCQGGVFCNCGHAHCLRYSKQRYNKEFPLNDNERNSFKATQVYIASYDGVVADISFNKAPYRQGVNSVSTQLDIPPFEIREDEQLVGVYGGIRKGFFQCLGLIVYRPPV